ncbi:MAG: ChaN family lipoprotein, partial [Desulfobacterales bacterium]|nr:ChaN family lipoprotein [Desulfobacterales bacterium]
IPFREDPLIGKIVNADTGRTVSYDTLVKEMENYDVIYLSEKHDNPMHHAVQHRIIQHFVDNGQTPVIGFEFFAMADTPLLLNFIDSKSKGHPEKMEDALEKSMRTKLGWDNQSDTMWSYYWDLLILARDNGLRAVGLDLESVQKRRITRKGRDGITGIEAQQLYATGLADPVYETHMKSIFKAVHCGMDHGGMTAKLYDTWVARNDRMALSITQIHRDIQNGAQAGEKTNGPVIVIMGNGHTEYGLGVIDRVTHITPDISQVNLSLMEIFREPAGLDAYLERLDLEGFPPAPPADYIWFTQRTSYEDPCERFKESLQHMKRKGMKKK